MALIEFALVLAQPLLTLQPPEPRQDAPPRQDVLLRYVPPAADASATYSFREESTLAVDRLRSTMGASVFEGQAPDRAVKQVAQRVWVDTTLAGESEMKLRRSFAALSASMEVTNLREGAPRPDGSATANSTMVGRTVEFADTASDVRARFSDESSADLLVGEDARPPVVMPAPDLDALSADCSLQGFLPPGGKKLTVGEEWSVDAAAMRDVFAPGGDIVTYYGPIQNQQDPDVIARFGAHAVSRFGAGPTNGALSGEVKAKLLGTELRDGVRLARVRLRFDVQLDRDPAQWMRVQSAPFEMAKIGQTAMNASHSMTVVGEGALLWDLDHHRFVEFSASSKATSDQRLDYSFVHRGTAFSGDEHFELSGTTTLKLSAEYGDD